MFLVEGRLYKIDDILNLTGITALHDLEKRGKDFDYSLKKCFENSLHPFFIEITSEYFLRYKIYIDLRNKVVQNELIISSGIEQGIIRNCIITQFDTLQKLEFKTFTLYAAKQSIKRIINNVFVDTLFGYRVWGKHGFLMVVPDDKQHFLSLMSSHGFKDIEEVSEIYDSKYLRAKELWAEHGKAWFGEFDLQPHSRSSEILINNQWIRKKL